MAPEQAVGKSKSVGPATDVYALGAILYQLLTGQPPFQAETALDTLLQVISEEVEPPSRLCPDCPSDVEAICLKCLRKDPEERYASAAALAEDLNCFLAGKPLRAKRKAARERFKRMVLIWTVVLLVLVPAAVFFAVQRFLNR
jgi:serine/threonine-protein kinase